MAYSAGDLRAGAGLAWDAATAAMNGAAGLRTATVQAATFGRFTAAAGLATGLAGIRDDHVRIAHDVHNRHLMLDADAQDTAAQGERLVSTTTATARQVGSIIAAMEGRE